MKQIILFASIMALSFPVLAQGKAKGKSKDKGKSETVKVKEDKDIRKHEDIIWDGTKDNDGGGPKPSKNQPAKVRAAFQRDYPNAVNVRWSKYRGDWTATFGNGLFTSTAVYHANGERRDTRTPVERSQVPRSILDEIFRKKPETQLGEIIKIEPPRTIQDIFRLKAIADGKAQFLYYTSDGKEVTYHY